jgi:hypothetical protein
MKVSLGPAVLTVGVLVALTGCAASDAPAPSEVTYQMAAIADVKAVTRTSESEVVNAISSESVTKVEQRPKGSLLSCRGDRNFRWAGGTDVHAVPGTDMDAAADELARSFGFRTDWSVTREVSTFGQPRVVLQSPGGDEIYITFDADDSWIFVDSFSRCFHLRDDESPHGFY